MSDVPVVKATPIADAYSGGSVQVVAPLDLQEGYQLQVNVNGSNATVTVPAGGVKEGQTFTAQIKEQPMGAGGAGGAGGGAEDPSKIHNIPSGNWRDGLCDCFKFGCCHAMCWLGWCIEPVLVGQVMTRMSRNIFGGPGPSPSVSNTCMTVTCIMIFVFVVQSILQIVMDTQSCWGARQEWDPETNEETIRCPDGSTLEATTTFQIVRTVSSLVGIAYFIYMLCAICNTRRAIRNKYNIPPGCCGGCDDCCCSFWCTCCTVQQMARHTNDYSQYDVGCCSNDCCNKRGQQAIVPEIV